MAREMQDKTVIVTGCNTGIGKETVRELADKGARVIMACRNLEAANAARDEILKSTRNSEIIVKKLDLSSFKSIREFAIDVNTTEKRLDVLIHNAGYFGTFQKAVSDDGIELTMATNHYGPFLLTHLLIRLLMKSAPSKIIVLSSVAHRFAWYDLNPNPTSGIPFYVYFYSKLANIWFTKELARRLENSGVVVNAVHPGLVSTDIWRHFSAPLSWLLKLFFIISFISPFEGCQSTVKLACDENLKNVTGKYFSKGRVVSSSGKSNSKYKARLLWKVSERMVNLVDGDPRIEAVSSSNSSTKKEKKY